MNITSQPLRLIRICTCYLFSLRQTPGFSSRNQFPFVPRAMDSQGRYTSSPANGATYLLSDDGVILVRTPINWASSLAYTYQLLEVLSF